MFKHLHVPKFYSICQDLMVSLQLSLSSVSTFWKSDITKSRNRKAIRIFINLASLLSILPPEAVFPVWLRGVWGLFFIKRSVRPLGSVFVYFFSKEEEILQAQFVMQVNKTAPTETPLCISKSCCNAWERISYNPFQRE